MQVVAQLLQRPADLSQIEGFRYETADLRVRGGHEVLSSVSDFLKQLLARSDADEFDLDVFVRFEAAQFDHLSRQIDDPDGLAHVQDENLPTDALGGTLEDEHGCFRNGHKIPRHLRVS